MGWADEVQGVLRLTPKTYLHALYDREPLAQLAAQDPLEHNTWLYEHDVEAALRGSDVASPLR